MRGKEKLIILSSLGTHYCDEPKFKTEHKRRDEKLKEKIAELHRITYGAAGNELRMAEVE